MSTRAFRLGIFGFSETERRVMASATRLAASRGREYRLLDGAARAGADIAIVDMDDAAAVADWKGGTGTPPPALEVRREPPGEEGEGVHLRRPFTVRRLLDGLDAVAMRNYRYVSGLVIGEDGADDASSADEAVLAAASRAAETAERSGRQALVVDDSAAVRRVMGIELGLFGVDVDYAATGEEALERLREGHYDLVFLDLVLPGMDGYAVCRAIRRDPRLRGLMIIMLTGRGSRIDRIRGAMAGCTEYLTKPVAQEALHEVLQRHLLKEKDHARQQGAGG